MEVKALQQMLSHYTGVPEQVQIIKAIEHQGDEITHSILTKLNQTFITPFDREDIHALSSQLDDVIALSEALLALTRAPLSGASVLERAVRRHSAPGERETCAESP